MSRIEIFVNRRPKRRGPSSPRGPLNRRREPEYLPRRKAGGINFYDWGQVFEDGSPIDLPFHKAKPYSWSFLQNGSPFFQSVATLKVDRFTGGDFDEFYNEFLSIAANQWKTVFRRIEKSHTAQPYSLTFNGTDLTDTTGAFGDYNWTEDGLIASTAPTSVAASGAPFCAFNTANTTDFKITTSPDPTAPVAVYVPSKNFDVFLVPKLGLHVVASGEYFNGGDNLNHEFLSFQYRVYPRNLHPRYEDPTLPIASSVDTGGRYSAFLNKLKSEADARASSGDLSDISPWPPAFTSGVLDPTTFPATSASSWWYAHLTERAHNIASNTNTRAVEPTPYSTDFNGDFFESDAGLRLCGAIRQAGVTYYIWDSLQEIVSSWISGSSVFNGNFRIEFGPDSSFLHNS